MSISKINQEALNFFNRVGFPSHNDEHWKHTNLNHFHTQKFSKSNNHLISKKYDSNFLNYDQIVTINGKPIINNNSSLIIDSISNAIKDNPKIICSFDITNQDYNNPFLILNTIHFSDGIYIKVPKNTCLNEPVYLLSVSDDPDNFSSSYPRLYIDVEQNSEIKIIQHHIGNNQQIYYRNNVSYINAQENSRVFFANIYEESEKSFSMNNLILNQSTDSHVNTVNFFLKTGFFRSDIKGNLNGKGSSTSIDGLFLGNKKQFIDNNIIINHNKEKTNSRVMYKGILKDSASAVFNGLVNVPFKSKYINSDQKNHNIILSNSAKINSNPKLKISCDEVKCSHGSTTGNLDKEALFYLQSRGIKLKQAKKILLNSFMDEIIQKASFLDIKNYLDMKISELV